MIMLLSALSGLLLGFMTGGKLVNLKNFTLRHGWLLGIYAIIDYSFSGALTEQLNSLQRSYIVLLLFIQYASIIILIYMNRQYTPLLIIGAGELLNVLVIFANCGRMPVSEIAIVSNSSSAHQLATGQVPHYSLIDINTRFSFLGDIIQIKTIFTEIMSIGDLLILIGLPLFIITLLMPKKHY